eukprot:COSAG06_NODE_4016_length_4659_cov_2.390570_1_plen_165_part_00
MRLGAQPRTDTCQERNWSIARRNSCPAQHLKRNSASMTRRRHKVRHKVRHKTRRHTVRHTDHVGLGPSIAKAPWRSNHRMWRTTSCSSHCPPPRHHEDQFGSTSSNSAPPKSVPILSCILHSHCSYNRHSSLLLRAPVTPRVCIMRQRALLVSMVVSGSASRVR